MPKGYKGKTKAEVRAIVLANNKNKDASDKSRMNLNTEIKLWSLQNRDLKVKATTETSTNKPKVKEEGFSNYGQNTVNKKLARDETYSDYARSINREAPEEGLYKNSPTPKRGFIMKRNRK